jgi:hypothetical protein
MDPPFPKLSAILDPAPASARQGLITNVSKEPKTADVATDRQAAPAERMGERPLKRRWQADIKGTKNEVWWW